MPLWHGFWKMGPSGFVYPELESPPIALCCRNATTALKSLLCSGTEQIKEDGMRALCASLSRTELEELEDTQDTRWTRNLFSLKIPRCLIFSLSTCRLNLVLNWNPIKNKTGNTKTAAELDPYCTWKRLVLLNWRIKTTSLRDTFYLTHKTATLLFKFWLI